MLAVSLPATTLNRWLKQRGYRIERTVDYGPHRLPALDLAVAANRPEDPGFTVVQIGAHDGRQGDPLHTFVDRYGWRGVLLEPQPDVFSALTRHYAGHPQLALVNAALTDHDGTIPMYRTPGKTLRASTQRTAGAETFTVPAVTFRSLIETHRLDRVDLLVIDTEGFDYTVVRLALASGLRPRVLCYEHLHLTTADRTACADLLAAHGYRLLRDGTDTVAVR